MIDGLRREAREDTYHRSHLLRRINPKKLQCTTKGMIEWELVSLAWVT
jgi:hypothetical protein